MFLHLHSGNRPYWWDIKKVLDDTFNDLKYVVTNIGPDLAKWVQDGIKAKDPVKALSGGALTTVSTSND